jgi:hypothetical protein
MKVSNLALLVCALFASDALVAEADTPKKGAKYLAKIKDDDSRDPTIRLKVSGNGKKLDLIGPHEACNDTFNPVTRTHPNIKGVKVGPTGKFKRSRTYEVPSDTGAVVYMWTVTVKGRFVSKDTAKGTLKWHMKHGGDRAHGQINDCGANSTKFTAKRGVPWPGNQ